ncbi:3-hydroxyacyl-ACP dehydratase FabZ family protein, partial [Saccharomonospora saliphila]|uniref:3-hydroxyacyl-ACP dehydratase FabZ family protein n=1 Tax=Saccharomonospora saliphila TaxID=369829 RepID=UPI00035D379A
HPPAVSADPVPARSPTEAAPEGATPDGPAPALDAAGIRALLPHRYPVLLVDQVTELVPGRRLTARKAVSGNEPWYAGTGATATRRELAYPQTLLIESWCQAAGVLATARCPNPDVTSGRVMLFGGLSGVEFAHDVLPGDLVEHHVEIVRELSDTVLVTGRSTVAGRVVLTVERVVMTFRPAEALRAAPSPEEGEAR